MDRPPSQRGYTKRANSVTPLYPSELRLDEKIACCEGLYRARGLSPIFRLTSLACPPDLDDALARHAYLQVVRANAPALGLYGRLGVREVHHYGYRVP